MGLSNAERQARFRAQRAAEVERLRKQLAAAPQADAINRELTLARLREAALQDEIERLKAKIVKPVKPIKPPLDPESEAARQIDALKKKNKALQQQADRWFHQLRMQIPPAVKLKVAKALTEQTTSPEKRLDALQAWNGLGLNNIGK
jgi:hypothetical protein